MIKKEIYRCTHCGRPLIVVRFNGIITWENKDLLEQGTNIDKKDFKYFMIRKIERKETIYVRDTQKIDKIRTLVFDENKNKYVDLQEGTEFYKSFLLHMLHNGKNDKQQIVGIFGEHI